MGRRKAEFTEHISYRLRKADWDRIETRANTLGISVEEWCRRAAIEKLEAGANGPDPWDTYQLLAQIRFLLGHGLRLMATGKLSLEEFEKVRKQLKQSNSTIARDLLEESRE